MEKYEILEQVGEGSFGQVYKAKNRPDGKIVALKVISKRGRSSKELESLRQEYKIQRRLCHPNILPMRDSFETKDKIVVVTKYADRDLCDLLAKEGRLSQHRVQVLACNLVSALYYLHSRRILHRDLKPQNVLIKPNKEAMLCDFGFARSMSTGTHVLTSIKGTPLYMAPEIIDEHPYDHNADLWSLGCIVYQMSLGTPPFKPDSILSLIRLITFEPVEWPESDIISEECKSFLQGLLQKDPSQRLTWPNLLTHPFVHERILIVDEAVPTPFDTPLSASQARDKQLQLRDLSLNLADWQVKFIRESVSTVYGRILQTMLERKRTPALKSIPVEKNLVCVHRGSLRTCIVYKVLADHLASFQGAERREKQNREVEETTKSNQPTELDDDASSVEQPVILGGTEGIHCQRSRVNVECASSSYHETYPENNDTADDDVPRNNNNNNNNNRLPDWNPTAVKGSIENEEWVAFLQRTMKEIMDGQLDSLLEENCASVLISPLNNPTVNCRVVGYIARLLSLPLVLPQWTNSVYAIMEVYIRIGVVPNLVFALKLLMSDRSEPINADANTRLASELSADELQTLEYAMLTLCALFYQRKEFLLQFCEAISVVNGIAFLQQLLTLEKRKARVVADLVAILNKALHSQPESARLVEKVVLLSNLPGDASEQLVRLLTQSDSTLRARTCQLIRLLGKRCRDAFQEICCGTLRDVLEKLITVDPEETVRRAAEEAFSELRSDGFAVDD